LARHAELWHRIIHPDDFELVTSGERLARERSEPFRAGVPRGSCRRHRPLGARPDAHRVRRRRHAAFSSKGFLVDVTERKESANLFQAIFDGAFER